ncbi:MAG: 6-carboxytetrahydropterin synthase QueD [Gammaproteobacteria bacterium]|nr:6-carboxytetrahydropterin synthase QueD [Gammaproteobacteria bacterium]
MATTLYRKFTIEAGRYLSAISAGHPCARMHGHTFIIQVHVTGPVQKGTGWVMDFAELDGKIQAVRQELDHKVLNDIGGLENPTTELLARWIWDRLAGDLPGLSRIVIQENPQSGCIYTGDIERDGRL